MLRGRRPALSSATTASTTEYSLWRRMVSASITSSAGVSGVSWRRISASRPSRTFWTMLQPASYVEYQRGPTAMSGTPA